MKDLKLLNELQIQASKCMDCPLGQTRNNIVFSDGNPEASIVLIGEAPGADEDKQGKPFVGRAGKLLNVFLKEAKIDRQNDIYIINTVKCRPPENRVPTPLEKKACKRYLDSQISIVLPKIIILCGATAVKSFLTKAEAISKIRGQFFEGPYNSKLIPIFHPSYLLRNHSTENGSPRDLTLKDLIKIKELSV